MSGAAPSRPRQIAYSPGPGGTGPQSQRINFGVLILCTEQNQQDVSGFSGIVQNTAVPSAPMFFGQIQNWIKKLFFYISIIAMTPSSLLHRSRLWKAKCFIQVYSMRHAILHHKYHT